MAASMLPAAISQADSLSLTCVTELHMLPKSIHSARLQDPVRQAMLSLCSQVPNKGVNASKLG